MMAEGIPTPDEAIFDLDADVVLSSRARIARNVSHRPFVHRADPAQCKAIIADVRTAVEAIGMSGSPIWIDLNEAASRHRRVLYERHIISRQHAESHLPRGVIVDDDETTSIMINEEDHVRMHTIAPGLQTNRCFERIGKIDIALEPQLGWAFHERYGYLSACPSNAGTGVRFSAMLHLPAVGLTGDLDKVQNAAKDLKLAVRGYYGEGSESSGNFYQISNQITLGCSEEELLEQFQQVIVPGIIQYERSARRALIRNDRVGIEDRVRRDIAVLRAARLLKADECMRRLSTVRLGVCMGIIDDVELRHINSLFVLIQSGHLHERAGDALTPREALSVRADAVREMLE
jgi:protein arginine kinase